MYLCSDLQLKHLILNFKNQLMSTDKNKHLDNVIETHDIKKKKHLNKFLIK